MKRYNGMTLEQHQQIADDLLAIQEKAHRIMMQISKAYGTSRKQTKNAVKLENKLTDLRFDMDSAYFNDIKPQGRQSPYYPRRES
jgi:hypothetical protein